MTPGGGGGGRRGREGRRQEEGQGSMGAALSACLLPLVNTPQVQAVQLPACLPACGASPPPPAPSTACDMSGGCLGGGLMMCLCSLYTQPPPSRNMSRCMHGFLNGRGGSPAPHRAVPTPRGAATAGVAGRGAVHRCDAWGPRPMGRQRLWGFALGDSRSGQTPHPHAHTHAQARRRRRRRG